MNGGGDGLFEHLVGKQAQREVNDLNEQELTDSKRAALHRLFASLSVRGSLLSAEDIDALKEETGISLPTTTLVFAGFLRGVLMDSMEDPEIRTEVLGNRGVCLMTGSSILGFHDYADGVAYMGNPGEFMATIQASTTRFDYLYVSYAHALKKWGGLAMTETGVEFDGVWVDTEKLDTLEKVIASCVFAETKLDHDYKDKLESIKFDREMRRAMDAS